MANIMNWLLAAETESGERIEVIVVGRHYYHSYSDDTIEPDENIILSREAGLDKLNLNFDSGYGGADCYPMYAWTKNRVYCIHEYDGAIGLNWLPRNPIACTPGFGGNS